jgi:hypothetical protein
MADSPVRRRILRRYPLHPIHRTLANATAVVAGIAIALGPLASGPARADCTSSLRTVATAQGGWLPRRHVACSAPSARTARERRARLLARCRSAGFGDACEQLASGRRAAIERHLARVARARAARSERAPASSAERSDGPLPAPRR